MSVGERRAAEQSAATQIEEVVVGSSAAVDLFPGVRLTEARLEQVDVYNAFVRLVRDEQGQLYLLGFCDGVLPEQDYRPEEGYDRLDLALPLSRERLQALEQGSMNLRQAYLDPEAGELAMAVFWPDGRVNLNFLAPEDVFFQFLPGPVPLKRRRSA